MSGTGGGPPHQVPGPAPAGAPVDPPATDAAPGTPPVAGSPVRMRKVQSFVRREGRITDAQQRALDVHRDRWMLAPAAMADPQAAFGRVGPLLVEIGFGNGDALFDFATRHPDWNVIGIEVWRPGIGRLLGRIVAAGLDHVRLVEGDAAALLADLPAGALAALHLFFPDPWPKTRHHKRRLVQPAFATAVARVLAPGGVFRLATDWRPYAEHMLEVLDACPELANAHGPGGAAPGPVERPRTRFEARGERLGNPATDLVYRRR